MGFFKFGNNTPDNSKQAPQEPPVYDEERIRHENEIVLQTSREQTGFTGYQNTSDFEDCVDSTPPVLLTESDDNTFEKATLESENAIEPVSQETEAPDKSDNNRPIPPTAETPHTDYSLRFDDLAMQLDSMFEKVEMFQSTIAKQNQIIEEQNRTIVNQNRQLEKHNEDIVMKLQKPILLQIIEYVDRLQEILDNDDSLIDKDHTTRLSELRNNVEILQKTIVADLENHQIYQFKDTEDNPLEFSLGRQQVKDREESSNENEFMRYGEGVKMFYRTTFPGYLMTAENKNGEPVDSILRREEVVKVIYRPIE